MELQFEKETLCCLRQPVREIRSQEQTQEVRVEEGLPDAGRVISAWGQVILRSKEWRGDSMQAAAGVMAWILYAPEDGSAPQCLETWVPIQMQWEFPQSGQEAVMCMQPLLRQIDARTISPRKLMLRVSVGILGQVWEPMQAQVCRPGDLPEGIELLKHTYPVTLAREAGEKSVSFEEELQLPASNPPLARVWHYELLPRMQEQRVLSGKLVFRGTAVLHLLYGDEQGEMAAWDFELPFSQLAELEQTFSEEARAAVLPVVTNLELEAGQDGQLQLHAALAAQYVVTDQILLELPEDAYSPLRAVTPQLENLDLPCILERSVQTVRMEEPTGLSGSQPADLTFYPAFPQQNRRGEEVETVLSGVFSVLERGEQGQLEERSISSDLQLRQPADADACLTASLMPASRPQMGAGMLRAEAELQLQTLAVSGMQMLTGITVGEQTELSNDRPTLVLRRFGEESLWELAKRCGSTVGAIQTANHLKEEPLEGQMLLIPVV